MTKPVYLYTAPANGGKTEFTLGQATQVAKKLMGDVVVCVATNEQAKQWRRRLAQTGGGLGIHVFTFERLMRNVLEIAGTPITSITEPVQFRILRQILQDESIKLNHFQAIRGKVGLVQVLEGAVRELKTSLITPEKLNQLWATAEPRLAEISQLYTHYQTLLIEHSWADNNGVGWLAIEALERDPNIGKGWPLLIFDGFGSFTPLRRQVLRLLAQRVPEIIITLTRAESVPYPRFEEVIHQLENDLKTKAKPLPQSDYTQNNTLNALCRGLFNPKLAPQLIDDDSLVLAKTPTQTDEVRTALRWLKQQHVQQSTPLNEMALISHDITAYESYIRLIASEYGIPIRFVDGHPLDQNPAIDSITSLLKLFLPISKENPDPKMPYRQLEQVWSSPYLSWNVIELEPKHVRGLARATVARKIINRQSAWVVELQKWSESEDGLPGLSKKFEAFLKLIRVPKQATMRQYVIWLERLIGKSKGISESDSLNIALQARQNPPTAERDITALQALKDILRELLQSSEMLGSPRLNYTDFVTDLLGIIDATRYKIPVSDGAITITSVVQARGLSFDVVAILGLSEGLFPATIREDPFLRDSDRSQLQESGIEIDYSTRSFEREYFYQMVGLPRKKLLFTRPTRTDDGAEWVESAFWQELQRVVDIKPIRLPNGQPKNAADSASLPELFTYLAEFSHQTALQWVNTEHPERIVHLSHGIDVLAARQNQIETSPHNGVLGDIEADLAGVFGEENIWSPTEFESYLTCPYFYFADRVLKLSEPDQLDTELDISHIGSIYHNLFQALYDKHGDHVAEAEGEVIEHWLQELAPAVFAKAQQELNFIPTAWWPQQQKEILDTAVKSIVVLENQQTDYHTPRHEYRIDDVLIAHPEKPEQKLRIKGRIDRIDVNNAGEVRLIDYKSGGSAQNYRKDIKNSKKIQLVLYALAAQADPKLDSNKIKSALYWHIKKAEASNVPLQDNELVTNGFETAYDAADRIQNGKFQPQVPQGGCPSYCPAASFCWYYDPAGY